MKKLVLETTAPFQGLPELVAYDEGLFEREGITVEWADREQGVEKKVETHVTSPKGVDPFASHGKLFEQGRADMYNACEWGNYCRVQETGAGSRQLGQPLEGRGGLQNQFFHGDRSPSEGPIGRAGRTVNGRDALA